MSNTAIRSYIVPILAWEGADYILQYLMFTINAQDMDFEIGQQDDETEAASFAAWAKLTPSVLMHMSEREQRELVHKYIEYRGSIKKGTVESRILYEDAII